MSKLVEKAQEKRQRIHSDYYSYTSNNQNKTNFNKFNVSVQVNGLEEKLGKSITSLNLSLINLIKKFKTSII